MSAGRAGPHVHRNRLPCGIAWVSGVTVAIDAVTCPGCLASTEPATHSAGHLERSLAQDLSAAMVARGMTRAELARRLRVNRAVVTRMLSGDRMTVPTLRRICDELGLRIVLAARR